MKKRYLSQLRSVTLILVVSICGCSESGPTSVTEDLDQTAIEAYKEQERQIELDAMNDMELGE